MPLNDAAAGILLDYAAAFARSGRANANAFLGSSLRLLLKWRSQAISAELVAKHGGLVLGGPFAGMLYLGDASEGGLAPRLLGTYESELHPVLEGLVARGVDRIIDVGCAEGYYAVGLARMIPDARVEAYDIDPKARAACAELARRNEVADRVEIRERFDIETLDEVPTGTLVFVDAEGAEAEILSEHAPDALRNADLIVETHPGLRPGVTELLRDRFAPTHEVEVVRERLRPAPPELAARFATPLDEFLALWEWRATPTPWLVMHARAKAGDLLR
ncbi:MAG: methyltransferase [Caulobacteraceae bacterium]|nr:methyltransferase [Caulobacter sp.]